MNTLIALFSFLFTVNHHTSASPIFQQNGNGVFGNKFQGDIKLTKQQEHILLNTGKNGNSKTGWTWLGFRWPMDDQGFVTVPYRIDSSEGFLRDEVDFIVNEFHIIESSTCIRFVPQSTEENFIEIINGNGCWSWLGMVGGAQELSLDRDGCLHQGTPVHEAIHALGYDHMQNHINRDDYVEIIWDNILPEYQHNFDKVDPEWFDNFETPYDLLSVMHYPRWAFSRNGLDAIVPHDIDYLDKIGSNYASDDDILRLNRMYNCYH